MAIPEEDVAQVRAATDIVALIGEHAALKQSGRRWTGLCPFHAEKSPSFSVNAQEGFYYCFGCQASGDAITFVRAIEHLDFVDAVRMLADRAGVTLHEDAEAGADRKRRAELFDAMEQAVVWYHERLLSAKDAGRARDYLRSRGYDGAVVRQFRLGWAPDDWDALSRALHLSERVLTDSGLGFVNKRGRNQDAFRGRIIFPICDPSGKPVALGGRILPPRPGAEGMAGAADRRPEPKYKNSQETAIYSKRRTLYALNWAKKDIVASGEVVVCEGYTDVIGLFGVGIPRAVATCGTALAEEHFTLLRNFGKRIVLAYDADSAGQSATQRVYEWERRHEVDVAVAALPAGSDPGELARTDPEALRAAITGARPFLQFRVDRVFQAGDLTTAEGRARAADAALSAVAEHPDDLVRDQYVMQVADRCRLEPARVRERLEQARARLSAAPPAAGPGKSSRRTARPETRTSPTSDANDGDPGPIDRGEGSDDDGRDSSAADFGWRDGDDHDDGEPAARRTLSTSPSSRPELEALRWAVHRPEAVADRLEEILFADDRNRRAFEALAGADSNAQAIEDAPPDVADLLRRILVEEPPIVDDRVTDPVDAVVYNLLRESARRALLDLQALARSGSGDLAAPGADVGRIRLWLEQLDDPATGREAAERLLAWLVLKGQQTP